MQRDRRLAVVSVTKLLHDLESSIDLTLIKGSELTAGLLESRINAKLAASVGQGAFSDVIGALDHLTLARSKVIAAHHTLEEIRSELGLTVFSAGDLTKLVEPKGLANDIENTAMGTRTQQAIAG